MKAACLSVLFFTGITLFGKASEQLKSIIGFYIYGTKPNPSLKNGEATIKLHFNSSNFADIPKGYETIIYFSVNDRIDTLVTDPAFSYFLSIPSGPTVFKFWAGPGYNEVISDTISIENQTENEAMVSFGSENQLIEVDKPVIYLKSPVTLDFSLRVEPAGEFSFTYPAYSGQWKGTLHPNGAIEMNNQTYPYLFWDSKQEFQLEKQANGYHVLKKEILPFLEEQLSHAGLTSSEKTDFITYWGPRLTQFESVFIQFYTQEECNRFAHIQCDPKPEAINRLYIGFSEWNERFTPFLKTKELPVFQRSGFSVLEWGGFEFKTNQL